MCIIPTCFVFFAYRMSQEGRASDYTDPFEVLPKIQKRDFKFNRIPETLVVDHRNKTMKAMSFHHLHLLGPAIVMQVVVLPRVSFLFCGVRMIFILVHRPMSITRTSDGIFDWSVSKFWERLVLLVFFITCELISEPQTCRRRTTWQSVLLNWFKNGNRSFWILMMTKRRTFIQIRDQNLK